MQTLPESIACVTGLVYSSLKPTIFSLSLRKKQDITLKLPTPKTRIARCLEVEVNNLVNEKTRVLYLKERQKALGTLFTFHTNL